MKTLGTRGLGVLLAVLLGGCTTRRSTGSQCSFNSDCADLLVCAAGYCRGQCQSGRDCAAGQSCVNNADPARNVCVPNDQPSLCANVSCLATQLCVGAVCAFRCAAQADCVGTLGPQSQCSDQGLCLTLPAGLDASMSEASLDASPDGATPGVCTAAPARSIVAPVAGSCSGGAVLCGSECALFDTDPRHCGSCGNACTNTVCAGGRCRGYHVAQVELSDYVDHVLEAGPGAQLLVRGGGASGALGQGDEANHDDFVAVAGLPSPVSQVAAGYRAACVVAGDGEVWCWGSELGGLGAPDAGSHSDQLGPVRVAVGPAARVATGMAFACAVLRNGQVWCWGSAQNGQLGDNADHDTFSQPVQVPFEGATSGMAEVAVGRGFGCARQSDASGLVWCWGSNNYGVLGRGPLVNLAPALPVTPQRAPARTLWASNYHACMVLTDGGLWCWGENGGGQSAPPATRDPLSNPTQVALPAGSSVQSLSGNTETTCAQLCSGRMLCWGNNSRGQFGPAVPANSTTDYGITQVTGGTTGVPEDLVGVSMGMTGCIGLRVDGSLVSWSGNTVDVPALP